VIYSIPARGFTAAVSVFWGTPPAKPLICKSWSNRSGALFNDRWANPSGGKPRLSCASIRLVLWDIVKTSFDYNSQLVHLSLVLFITVSGEQKTLLARGKQGEEILYSIRYLLTSG
jgi:hypothetical protein